MNVTVGDTQLQQRHGHGNHVPPLADTTLDGVAGQVILQQALRHRACGVQRLCNLSIDWQFCMNATKVSSKRPSLNWR